MASINYAIREISVKIVYYGPGLGGKTTNLQIIHRKIPIDYRCDMVSLATETDRTLFFDFLPLDLGKIKGFSIKFQMYTVPGQVYYNETRKLVLRGVDGIVFVADSAQDKTQENLESLRNLHDNLAEYGVKQGSIPIVLQYNKRDLPNALPVEIIDKTLNTFGYPWNEAVANQGKGVFESLKLIGKIVIDSLNRKYSRSAVGQTPHLAHTPPVPHPQPQQAPNRSSTEPFYSPPQPQARLQQARPGPQAPRRNDYYDYDAISLEPMTQEPSAPQAAPESFAVDKTELDLEIEKYQKEIEDKQRGFRSVRSSQTPQQEPPPPQQRQNPFPSPQKGSYDVYDLPETGDRIPQFPPRQAADSEESSASAGEERPLYFTSAHTGRQKKTKRQGSFLSRFFNKDKPQ